MNVAGIKEGTKLKSKGLVMVVTSVKENSYHGHYEYKGKAIEGLVTMSKSILSNPHFSGLEIIN